MCVCVLQNALICDNSNSYPTNKANEAEWHDVKKETDHNGDVDVDVNKLQGTAIFVVVVM